MVNTLKRELGMRNVYISGVIMLLGCTRAVEFRVILSIAPYESLPVTKSSEPIVDIPNGLLATT